MNLKKITASLAFFAFGVMTCTHAQIFNSGDKDMDASLTQINVQAKLDLTSFKLGLKAEFSLTTEKATVMLKTMEPADLYMVVLVSQLSGKKVELVSASYIKNKGKGWGVIAKEMGIKPGSPAFHKLKESTKAKHDKMKPKASQGGQKIKANPKGKNKLEIKPAPVKQVKGKAAPAKVTEEKLSPGKSK